MVNRPILLSGIWIAVMLTYLLGDVLRIYSGDYEAGKMGSMTLTQGMWMAAAILMLGPILMIVLCLMLPQPVNRWANIIAAALYLVFNLAGLPTYPSAYDKFLIAVSLVFNGLTVWFAWNWV